MRTYPSLASLRSRMNSEARRLQNQMGYEVQREMRKAQARRDLNRIIRDLRI